MANRVLRFRVLSASFSTWDHASFSSFECFVFELGFGVVFDLRSLVRFRPFECFMLCSSFSSAE